MFMSIPNAREEIGRKNQKEGRGGFGKKGWSESAKSWPRGEGGRVGRKEPKSWKKSKRTTTFGRKFRKGKPLKPVASAAFLPMPSRGSSLKKLESKGRRALWEPSELTKDKKLTRKKV